jgi:hypothetical protein
MRWLLFYEHYSQQYVQDSPSESDLHTAIHALNGNSCTLISLEMGEEALFVGGGENDQVIVVYIPADETIPSMTLLNNPARSQTQEIELVVGQQLGNYPGWMPVSRDLAQAVLLSFYHHQQIPRSDTWMNDW